PVGAVTAVTLSAGLPSNFNLFAGIQTGVPIITLPIKIHLENPALGPSCFIGSDQNPILLNPENTDLSSAISIGGFFGFDPTGVPDLAGADGSLQITGGVQGDDTFAVPGAEGCGPNGDGSLDAVVNAVVGLPSPPGSNHLVLADAASALAFPGGALFGGTVETGQQFAADWPVGVGQEANLTRNRGCAACAAGGASVTLAWGADAVVVTRARRPCRFAGPGERRVRAVSDRPQPRRARPPSRPGLAARPAGRARRAAHARA